MTSPFAHAQVVLLLKLAGRAHAVRVIPAILLPRPLFAARALLVICRIDRQRKLQVDLAQHAPEVRA